ncbi:radical SAM/SPASM domain-containing protein [uncultured Ilyobacter sp.]|uniref:radical SAM/SPASM domain-containing protein n=1 Tax=uncultured Ilyobacter sp. TaxID=544433 RepID=UPI0029C6F076|nr:radical SAM protein [uncultured Ilyobacter sp.]
MNPLHDAKSLVLWMTNDCNLRCKYCYAEAGRKKEYMDFETAKLALHTPKNEKFSVQLTGGEPLMNFEIIEKIYEEIKNSKLNVSRIMIQTNGTLITPEIAKKIKKMNIALGVSLDGPPAANEKLRGKTSMAIDGLRALAAEGLMVNLNCVVTSLNVNYLKDLVDFAFYLGNVKGIGLDLLRKVGYANDFEDEIREADPADIKENLIKAHARTNELFRLSGKKIIIREIEEAKIRLVSKDICKGYCYAMHGKSMVVVPNGGIYPCGSFIGDPGYHMGNIKNIESLRKIKIENNKPKRCVSCIYNDICPGGCPSRVIVNVGKDQHSEQDCILRRTSFEIVKSENSIKKS